MNKYPKGSIGWLKELAKESGYPYEIKDNVVGPFIKWAQEKEWRMKCPLGSFIKRVRIYGNNLTLNGNLCF